MGSESDEVDQAVATAPVVRGGGHARGCRVRERLDHRRRMAVDRAIVERGADIKSLRSIHTEHGLGELGIGWATFRRYAERVEAEARDYFLASMLGAVFGQLDGERRGQMHEAAQNMMAMLLLKTARSLGEELGLDELAKLVRINLDLRKAAAVSLGKGYQAGGDSSSDGIAEQVRRLYGIEFDGRGSDGSNEGSGGGDGQREC